MKFLTHLVDADVRRHRLALATWVILVISATAVDGVRPTLAAESTAARGMLSLLETLLGLAALLLVTVLVPLVVQSHPLVGTDAFWMTRPIPPRILLTSKALLLGVTLIVAPVVAEAILMVVYGVPVIQLVKVSAQTALYTTLWVALLGTAAALTPNLTRFAILCAGTLVAAAMLLATLIAVELFSMEDSPGTTYVDTGTDGTGFVVLIILAVCAAIAVIWTQYQTRSRRRSVPAGIAGLLVAYLAAGSWPWPLLSAQLEVPDWATRPPALRLAASPHSLRLEDHVAHLSQTTPVWKLLKAHVWISGIERGWSAQGAVTRARIHLDNGTALSSTLGAYPANLPSGADEPGSGFAVISDLLDARPLGEPPPSRRELTTIFFLRDAELRRLAARTGQYDGRFHVRLVHHAIEAVLPLEHGAVHKSGAFRFAIENATLRSGVVTVFAQESNARSLFDRRPSPDFSFYLRNGDAREMLLGYAHEPMEAAIASGFLPFLGGVSFGADQVSGFEARNVQIEFRQHANGEPLPIGRAWFDRAALVIVRTTTQGAVERDLKIAEFP